MVGKKAFTILVADRMERKAAFYKKDDDITTTVENRLEDATIWKNKDLLKLVW